MKSIVRYRSSITGRWVTEEFAKANPDTTQRETRLVPAPILTDPGE
jgi:hypothetical protein